MRVITVVVIFVIANLNKHGKAEREPRFRAGYIYSEDFASFYKLHLQRLSWPKAKLSCQREGAVLFYPNIKSEAEFVADMIKNKLPENPKAWIGISDILSEGDYETINGLSVEEIYVNWHTNEPNNANDNEDCVEISDKATMNDLPCEVIKPYICKKTLTSVEWNAFCEIPDKEYLYNQELDKCYKFHSKPLNWREAFAVCLAEESYLVVINSQKEADYLVKLTADNPKKYQGYYSSGAVHVGFYKNKQLQYTTILNSSLENSGYTKWGCGQPDNSDVEFCGSIFYNGGLNDMYCLNICYFVCEHDIGNINTNPFADIYESYILKIITYYKQLFSTV